MSDGSHPLGMTFFESPASCLKLMMMCHNTIFATLQKERKKERRRRVNNNNNNDNVSSLIPQKWSGSQL
ncbi:MAG: hypothetical protein M3275_11270 [Thermoproteota archaeon]|nr:hypothetical protein [Thermoproteota archaeon]